MMTKNNHHRNIFLSLVSQGLPLIIALVAIPLIIKNMGTERFGILTFLWVLISYLGLLDLGISRTLTKFIAKEEAQHSSLSSEVLSLGFYILLFSGLIGSLLLITFSSLITTHYLNISSHLISEARTSVILLALNLPAILIFTFLKSTLDGLKEFSSANVLHIANSSVAYLIPLLMALWIPRIDISLAALFILRWGMVIWGLFVIKRHVGWRWLRPKIKFEHTRLLISEGGWMTAITVLNPLFIYVDRLIVSALVPADQLAYYTTPFEIVARLWLIPSAVTRILFPHFSQQHGKWTPEVMHYFKIGNLWIFLLMLLPVSILFFFGEPLLGWWINPEFANKSIQVLRVALIGISFNAMTWVIFVMIQATSQSKWSVLSPLVTFTFSMLLFYPLIKTFGVSGAAMSWSLRLILDFFAFHLIYFSYIRKNV